MQTNCILSAPIFILKNSSFNLFCVPLQIQTFYQNLVLAAKYHADCGQALLTKLQRVQRWELFWDTVYMHLCVYLCLSEQWVCSQSTVDSTIHCGPTQHRLEQHTVLPRYTALHEPNVLFQTQAPIVIYYIIWRFCVTTSLEVSRLWWCGWGQCRLDVKTGIQSVKYGMTPSNIHSYPEDLWGTCFNQ